MGDGKIEGTSIVSIIQKGYDKSGVILLEMYPVFFERKERIVKKKL